MPQKSTIIQLSLLVGTILLGLLIGVYLVVGKRFHKPDPSDPVVRHSVDTQPEDVLKYWTANKMRDARPADMPNVTAPGPGKKRPRHSRHTADPEHS